MRIPNAGGKGKWNEEKWKQVKRMWWGGSEDGEEKVGKEKDKSRGGATREEEGKEKGGQHGVEKGPRRGKGRGGVEEGQEKEGEKAEGKKERERQQEGSPKVKGGG